MVISNCARWQIMEEKVMGETETENTRKSKMFVTVEIFLFESLPESTKKGEVVKSNISIGITIKYLLIFNQHHTSLQYYVAKILNNCKNSKDFNALPILI